MSQQTWRNWAGNHQVTPARVLSPRSTDEVSAAVRRAAEDGLTVRMPGTGHSFTGAAVAEGVMLRPGGLSAVRSIDTASGLVTAEAGLPLWRLNQLLDEHGLALANMGDIQEQTLAGASQTGTHGTGRDAAGLASQIVGLELVLADGSVVTCSRTERPELFHAATVGLGALGIVTAITWQTVPAFLLKAHEAPMTWDEVLNRLDELDHDNEHFEFFWFPHSEGCLTKRNNRVEGPRAPLGAVKAWLDDEFLSNTVFGAAQRLTKAFPKTIRTVNGISAKLLGERTYTDTSYKVFTASRTVKFREQEYAIPRENLDAALRELRRAFDRRGWQVSFPVEVRLLPAEDAWLSMAHGRRSAFIAIHMYRPLDHTAYFEGVEEIMTSLGGRPHWGKMHTRDAAYLEQVYPRFGDFAKTRDELDPDRRFLNPYTRRVLGA
ncbi:D-arabinono-1,4-lactone oxidase [Actinocorallia longicatena]|uniref:D-arabinono-1,4-lactone oxidase n=1 Tax=Actinocorallia longicatena TaxID=111803 RepID=A0ABP6QFC8_9ACTN